MIASLLLLRVRYYSLYMALMGVSVYTRDVISIEVRLIRMAVRVVPSHYLSEV
jgi:hypothetical protein